MTGPRREGRKQACDELARLLSTPGSVETAALLDLVQGSGRGEPGRAAPAERPADDVAREIVRKYLGDTPAPIGIWQPTAAGGDLLFVRDDSAPARDWWAPHATLVPKRSLLPLRLCLLGESTAAGWFYAPALTPARLLAETLTAGRGGGIWEVLDLTMVNLQPAALVDLAGAVLQLTPDVLVVFAGNNWPARLPSFPGAGLRDCGDAALALREAGMAGLRRLADERTRRSAERALAVLARVADLAGVPLVVVIPEVNLADWPRDRPVPWLPGDASRRWHVAHGRAIASLEAEAWAAGADSARQMQALDGGVCATSHRLLGDALVGLGRLDEARAAYLAAVDARTWDNFPSTPSATSAVRDAIRRGAREHGYGCVDLPAVFAEHLGAILPGRQLFLDYCHLTVDGMRVAMAAVAAETLRLSEPSGSAADWRTLLARAPAPSVEPATDAAVKFMTALYSAHYATPAPGGRRASSLARDWLEAALDAWPEIEATLSAYVSTRSVPIHASQLSAEHRRFHSAIGELERQTTHDHGLDPDLVEAVRAVLAARGRSLPAALEERFVNHHGFLRGRLDLVSVPYHWRLMDRHEGGGGFATEGRAFYRAWWPASRFCLVGDGSRPARLELTARLPAVEAPRQDEVVIEVNGTRVSAVMVASRWTRSVTRIPPELLRRGFNRVTLRWPLLPPEGDAALRQIVRCLEQGIPTDLHPVFGHVFTFLALPAD